MIQKPALILICSMALYFAARHFGWNLAALPSGFWYFNPFAWQLLFFLGAWIALGGAEAIQSVIKPGRCSGSRSATLPLLAW
jgi:hypothetical protein